ncbi:MAG: hypothetical protein WC840_02895 [Candidatus Peribacteraceae bacterium]
MLKFIKLKIAASIIAEYIGRIFEETKQRPRYITREIVNDHRRDTSERRAELRIDN